MNKITLAIATVAALGATPALAADMAVKAPPAMPAPSVPSWTGFYTGVTAGYGWRGPGDNVKYSPNDPDSAVLFAGGFGFPGEQPVVTSSQVNQHGAVGGFEAGYNLQAGSKWLWGLETDFTFSRMKGQASGTSSFEGPPGLPVTQSLNAQQSTDWYGTARARLGWLAIPDLLIFGTGGFAYGRATDSANFTFNTAPGITIAPAPVGGFGFSCLSNVPCFIGSSSGITTGWTAGGGAEWRFSQHFSLKAEYQFVDLGTRHVVLTALPLGGSAPPSITAAFRDQIQVARGGLNFHF